MSTLHEEIAHLATINDTPGAGITREVFTPTYRTGVDYVTGLLHDAGLTTREDAFGNLYGRWEGAEPDAPAVLTGSHVDTTLHAGAYDGVLGVLGAIDAVRRLRADGVVPRRSIEVVAVAGEEPRFGQGCIGSRAMTAALADPATLRDRAGVTLADALREYGLDPGQIGEAVLDPSRVHAWVELHIEQGIVLETSGEAIGLVEAIAAPHDFRLRLTGSADHAGATPMGLRRDALAGAGELLVAIERLARESASGTTVATVGTIAAAPGAINVIPGEVVLGVDVRDSDLLARTAVVEGILEVARGVCEARGLALDVEPIVEDAPAACSPLVIDAVAAACGEAGIAPRRMISGAYHDSLLLERLVPVGMLFVPSRGGVSHHPDEFTAPEQLDAGVAVLAGTLARLAS